MLDEGYLGDCIRATLDRDTGQTGRLLFFLCLAQLLVGLTVEAFVHVNHHVWSTLGLILSLLGRLTGLRRT